MEVQNEALLYRDVSSSDSTCREPAQVNSTSHLLNRSAADETRLPSSLGKFDHSGIVTHQVEPELGALDIVCISTLEVLEELKADWDLLANQYGSEPTSPYGEFNWNWHWCRSFLNDQNESQSLNIVVFRDGDQTRLILPLMRVRKLGVTYLKWMGAPVSYYGDVIADSESNISGLIRQSWSAICSKLGADVIALDNVRADSHIASALLESNVPTFNERLAPFANLHGFADYESFSNTLQARSRKNRRRHRRKLEKKGTVSHRFYESGPEIHDIMDRALELKRILLAVKDGAHNAEIDANTEDFLRDITIGGNLPVGSLVSALHLDGEPIAIEIGVCSQDTYISQFQTHDTRHQLFNPSALLTEEVLKHCIETGVKTYDLLPPEEENKWAWAKNSVPVYDFEFPVTFKGKLASFISRKFLASN